MEQMGKFQDAGAHLESLNREHPKDPDILWGLARLCLYQSRWKNIRTQATAREALQQAQDYLSTLTELKPHGAMALWQLAEVSRELGDGEVALQAYEKTLRQDASYKHAHRYIARLLAEKKRYRESLAKYEQAMAVDPEDLNLKKEAQKVALLAPQEDKRRVSERLSQWETWVPPEAKALPSSPVTVRVGLFTGMGRLFFPGQTSLGITD